MTNSKKYGILIGRFQPFHQGHLNLVSNAMKLVDHLYIMVGSSHIARNSDNPFTFEERRMMIMNTLQNIQLNVTVIPLMDNSDDNLWKEQVIQKFRMFVPFGNNVTLFGHKKDDSMYYLDMFPNWKYQDIDTGLSINATTIREEYFLQDTIRRDLIPSGSSHFLNQFCDTDVFFDMQEEFKKVHEYKDTWKNSPYPPIFVTCDTVIYTKSKKVLLIKRKGFPGKGLWALPGGFLNPGEKIVQGALRELEEETALQFTEKDINQSFVVDRLNRSTRGRTISHVFGINYEPIHLALIFPTLRAIVK